MALDYKLEFQRYKRYYSGALKVYQSRPKVKQSVSLAAALIASAALGAFAIKPTVTTIASLKADIRAQSDIDKRLEKKLENVRAAYDNYSKITDRLKVLDESFPSAPKIATFLRQVEAMGRDMNVKVTNITFDSAPIAGAKIDKTKAKKFESVTFGVNLTGEYTTLKEFLSGLEEMKRIAIIDNYGFFIRKAKEGEDSSLLNLTVNGSVVFQPGEKSKFENNIRTKI